MLAGEHSDDDDVANGWELGDPTGTWQQGDPAPGNPLLVTSPGQSGSVPPVLWVDPLEIEHSETQGENLSQTFIVENIGGDCYGNPNGDCTLTFDVASSDAWMAFSPEFSELVPLETQVIEILFMTDELLGDLEGTASILASGVSNSPQDVLVTMTVPEPSAAMSSVAALGVLFAMIVISRGSSIRHTTG